MPYLLRGTQLHVALWAKTQLSLPFVVPLWGKALCCPIRGKAKTTTLLLSPKGSTRGYKERTEGVKLCPLLLVPPKGEQTANKNGVVVALCSLLGDAKRQLNYVVFCCPKGAKKRTGGKLPLPLQLLPGGGIPKEQRVPRGEEKETNGKGNGSCPPMGELPGG